MAPRLPILRGEDLKIEEDFEKPSNIHPAPIVIVCGKCQQRAVLQPYG
jgi:hypothetical protein